MRHAARHQGMHHGSINPLLNAPISIPSSTSSSSSETSSSLVLGFFTFESRLLTTSNTRLVSSCSCYNYPTHIARRTDQRFHPRSFSSCSSSLAPPLQHRLPSPSTLKPSFLTFHHWKILTYPWLKCKTDYRTPALDCLPSFLSNHQGPRMRDIAGRIFFLFSPFSSENSAAQTLQRKKICVLGPTRGRSAN